MSDSPFEPIPLFSVPLFATMVNGHEQHRDALVKEVLAHQQRDPTGDVRSNRNGWHSGASFQDMIKRHQKTIKEHPHLPLGTDAPYSGIENLRPESELAREVFASWQ